LSTYNTSTGWYNKTLSVLLFSLPAGKFAGLINQTIEAEPDFQHILTFSWKNQQAIL